jgi:hypothetical protein
MTTSDQVRSRYFSNRFVERLRLEVVVDEQEWAALKTVLGELAREWQDHREVDKDVVQDLFVLPTIIPGVASRFTVDRPDVSHDLEERATEIEALILEALA